MNCRECQDLILENRREDARAHLGACPDCRMFEETYRAMMSLSPQKVSAPKSITFESLREKSREKKSPSFLIRMALPLAASFVIAIAYVFAPFRGGETPPQKRSTQYTSLSQNISAELASLGSSIEDMEFGMLSSDRLIETEIDSLWDEMENWNGGLS